MFVEVIRLVVTKEEGQEFFFMDKVGHKAVIIQMMRKSNKIYLLNLAVEGTFSKKIPTCPPF